MGYVLQPPGITHHFFTPEALDGLEIENVVNGLELAFKICNVAPSGDILSADICNTHQSIALDSHFSTVSQYAG
jgi:hypothetical protein